MDAALVALSEGATVITANNRLARATKLAYNRQQHTRGRNVWPTPRILPWREWMGDLCEQSLANSGTAGQRSLLSEAQRRTLWRDIVRSADPALLPGTASSVAQVVDRAWRLSQEWRLTPAQLMEAAESDDSRVFASLAESYRRRCEEEGWADAAMLVPLVVSDLQAGKLRPVRHIHLLGFDTWTPLQRDLLSVMRTCGWAVIEDAGERIRKPNVRQIGCRTDTQELELAARWARRIMEGDRLARVGIVVPDLAVRSARTRRAVLDVFAPDWRLMPSAELPVNFSYGEPLARAGLVHVALIALRALAGELDYRDAGQLLRSPYVVGEAIEAAARARLDLWARDRIGTAISIAALATRAADSAPLLAARLKAFMVVADAMPRRQGAAGWARTFGDALQTLGWPGDRPLASDEYQAGIAWREQIEELCRCDRVAGALSLDAALGLIGHLAGDHMFQPAGHPEAVQVLETLEAMGQRFDALWVCGLTAEAWPPAPRPDPLVPLPLQRRLRMPDSSPPMVRERAERMLRWLETSAPDVMVSYAEYSGEEALSPSPLIAHLPACTAKTLRLWDAPDRRAALAAARASEMLMADSPPAVDAGTRLRGGASLIERQARCPARAFLEFRLGARELRSPAVGIDARTRGAIIHGVLQDFFARIRDHTQLAQLAEDRQVALLDAIIQRQLEDKLPMGDAVTRRVAQQEHLRVHRLMTEFLRLERLRADFTVLSAETDLVPMVAPEAIVALGIKLRPDRVDRLPDLGELIIDYKTGQSLPARSELCGPRPRSPQLPLYAVMMDARAIALVQLAASGIQYLVIGEDLLPIKDIVTPAQLTEGAAVNWRELQQQWQSALQHLATEILAGDFRIDRRHRREAEGQWAMATRVHELPDEDEDGEQ
jgi:probable DNA repair protein